MANFDNSILSFFLLISIVIAVLFFIPTFNFSNEAIIVIIVVAVLLFLWYRHNNYEFYSDHNHNYAYVDSSYSCPLPEGEGEEMGYPEEMEQPVEYNGEYNGEYDEENVENEDVVCQLLYSPLKTANQTYGNVQPYDSDGYAAVNGNGLNPNPSRNNNVPGYYLANGGKYGNNTASAICNSKANNWC